MTAHRRRPSALWTLAHVACLYLVLSFVLFEVLDVDGSEFAIPLSTELTINLADPPEEICRSYLELAGLPSMLAPAAVDARLCGLERLARVPSLSDSRFSRVLSRDSRTTLPRASLDDHSFTS